MTTAGSAAQPGPSPLLRAKEARAQAVLAEVSRLDTQFGQIVEAYDGARVELDRSRQQLAENAKALQTATRQRARAQNELRARVVSLYEQGEPGTIDVLVGSKSVSDLLDRVQASQDVVSSDARVVHSVTATTQRLARVQARLRAVEHRKAVAAQQLASNRAQIGTMLAQRRTLLASVQSEVATIRAREQRQQALLAAAARARVARELAQAAARSRAQARAQAQARAAAAAAAAARAATPAPQTTTTVAQPTTTEAAPASDPVTTTAPTTTAPAPAPAPVPTPVAPTAAGHPEAAAIALRYLGVPYRWGGSTPSGFDCSGLVLYVYAQLGISLPHYAADQYHAGTPVARSDLQPGDLVFFDGLGHVGIYIGNGQMVHAPHTGDVVRITSLSEFGSRYVGARRL